MTTTPEMPELAQHVLSLTADRLAQNWRQEPPLPWELLRDRVDQATGGKVGPRMLDTLTNAVCDRLAKAEGRSP